MRAGTSYGRKKRFSPRFFVILAVLTVLIAGTVLFLTVPRSVHASYGTISDGQITNAIVIFSEAQIELPDNERIIFDVPNNSEVQAEQIIGQYYKKGYVASAFEAYVNLRQNIVAYQNEVFLKDIYQNELNQYAIEIDTVLTELQNFDSASNDYITVNKRLSEVLAARQEYIRSNYPADEYLQSLYDEEAERLEALNDWIQPIRAAGNGYVSWYDNEAYDNINVSTAASLTASDIKKLLAQKSIYKNINNSNDFTVRIISEEYIYAAAVMTGDIQPGRTVTLYTDVSNEALQGTVVSVNGTGEKAVVIRLECRVGDFLEHRIINISQSPLISGLTVPADYVMSRPEGEYVLAQVNGEKTEVGVRVIAVSGDTAVVEPLKENMLLHDTVIYSK